MKKTVCIGLLVMVLAFGMAVVSCEKPDETKDTGIIPEGGTITLTGIPAEYNGKYAFFQAGIHVSQVTLLGLQNITRTVYTMAKISGGSVTLSMWAVQINGSYSGYKGNDTVELGSFIISPDAVMGESYDYDIITGIDYEQLKFTNGNATVTWAQGTEWEE